jgi:hypothetical protein
MSEGMMMLGKADVEALTRIVGSAHVLTRPAKTRRSPPAIGLAVARWRRDLLGGFKSLAVSGEYIHRVAFDIAAVYGKDTFLAMRYLDMDRLPLLFKWKSRVDDLARKFLRLPGFGDHAMAIEEQMLPLLDARGAEYPAEHKFGHLYHAKPALQAHYRALDPCNCFNPGIGKTTRKAEWVA